MPEKNQEAVSMGRIGGLARMKSLTPEQRSELARKGAIAKRDKGRAKKAQAGEQK